MDGETSEITSFFVRRPYIRLDVFGQVYEHEHTQGMTFLRCLYMSCGCSRTDTADSVVKSYHSIGLAVSQCHDVCLQSWTASY